MNKVQAITLFVLVLSGCSLAPYEENAATTEDEKATPAPQPPTNHDSVQIAAVDEETVGHGTVLEKPSNPAVVALQKDAQNAVLNGHYDNAAMALERAVRIAPRDPGVWLELAKIRFTQGQYAQARELAQKARRLAGVDGQIRAEAERLINRAQ